MLTSVLAVLLMAVVCSGQRQYQSCGIRARCVDPNLCTDPRARMRLNMKETPTCDLREVCCSNDKIIRSTTLPPSIALRTGNYADAKCGHRNARGIVDLTDANMDPAKANEAEYGEFPWVIAVLEVKSFYGELQYLFYCGGSLIHPRFVLTAAHYVYNVSAETLIARAGEYEPHSIEEPYSYQERNVNKIIVHPKFHARSLIFDAALLILQSSFDIAPHINPICLPNAEIPPNIATCYVAGWGVEEFNTSRRPQKPKKIDMQVLSKERCNELLGKAFNNPYYNMHSSFICAGGEAGKDACTGDGGSPLMCPFPDSEEYYYQAGIVSWGKECGKADVPGVFANVLRVRLWIDTVLIDNNYLNE